MSSRTAAFYATNWRTTNGVHLTPSNVRVKSLFWQNYTYLPYRKVLFGFQIQLFYHMEANTDYGGTYRFVGKRYSLAKIVDRNSWFKYSYISLPKLQQSCSLVLQLQQCHQLTLTLRTFCPEFVLMTETLKMVDFNCLCISRFDYESSCPPV